MKKSKNIEISAQDLAQCMYRVGDAARRCEISFDNLLSIVIAAKNATGRNGATIGNSLKTVFTRLSREETLIYLAFYGVETTNANGEWKDGIDLLHSIAHTYRNHPTLRNYIAETIGGVYQINIVLAILEEFNV